MSTSHPHAALPAGPGLLKTARRIFHRHWETNTQMGYHGSPVSSKYESTKPMTFMESRVTSFSFVKSTTCYGPVKTQVGRFCGKPLLFSSCLQPCIVYQQKCTIACLDRPGESSPVCNNQQEHKRWGQKSDGSWAIAEETAYPCFFCW